jgi:uncharacterized membrane protein YbhN (UPF0104 family)
MTAGHVAVVSQRKSHPYRGFLLRMVLGIAMVFFLVRYVDARSAFRIVVRENPWFFVAAGVLYVVGHGLAAYRWQLLAGMLGLRGSFAEFLALYFVGLFINLFVPWQVGGDAGRAVYLGRRRNRMIEAVASVVANRVYGLLGLFWIAAAAALLLGNRGFPVRVARPVIVVGALSVVAFVSSPWLADLVHLMPRAVQRTGTLVEPYFRNPLGVLPAIGLSIAFQALLAGAQWLLALGLGLNLSLASFLLVVPLAGALSSLSLTPAGLGLREAVYLVLFGMIGLGHNDAVALGLLYFALITIISLSGSVAFISTGFTPRARERIDQLETSETK